MTTGSGDTGDSGSAASGSAPLRFTLYVAGTTKQSARAIVNTREMCVTHLSGRYELEIVDICKHPSRAVAAQLVAAPTLVRHTPPPVRRYTGDVSRPDKILADLGIHV
jgi:circadian clock protein KaiB